MMDLQDLRFEVEELYHDYVECLDDNELERWPEFFADDCLYKIVSRENFERSLPLAAMLCESKGFLKDRVTAIRQTSMFGPRAMRHVVSNIRVKGRDGGVIRVQANYAVFETALDEHTRVFNTGKYLDKLVRDNGRLKFKEKLCVFDSVLIPASLIYPI